MVFIQFLMSSDFVEEMGSRFGFMPTKWIKIMKKKDLSEEFPTKITDLIIQHKM